MSFTGMDSNLSNKLLFTYDFTCNEQLNGKWL